MEQVLFKNVTKVAVAGIKAGCEASIDVDGDGLAGDFSTRQAIKNGWLVKAKKEAAIEPKTETKKGELNDSGK